jgi:hypothetical protein
MKKFLICFLALLAPLFSQETGQKTNPPEVETSIDWNEDSLFFDIKLEKGFTFDKTYSRFSLENGGIGAEVLCFPPKPNPFFSEGQVPLREILVTIYLHPGVSRNTTRYEIEKTFVYQNGGSQGEAIVTQRSTGTLTNTTIDTYKPGKFFEYPDVAEKGYFMFTFRN